MFVHYFKVGTAHIHQIHRVPHFHNFALFHEHNSVEFRFSVKLANEKNCRLDSPTLSTVPELIQKNLLDKMLHFQTQLVGKFLDQQDLRLRNQCPGDFNHSLLDREQMLSVVLNFKIHDFLVQRFVRFVFFRDQILGRISEGILQLRLSLSKSSYIFLVSEPRQQDPLIPQDRPQNFQMLESLEYKRGRILIVRVQVELQAP